VIYDARNQSAVWRRFEAKYLIDYELAQTMRELCQSFLDPDPYSAQRPDLRYPIQSAYLDTNDRKLLNSAVNRSADRFKLRVRTYCSMTTSLDGLPAFFEIKRKRSGIVHKTRAMVPTAEVDPIYRNQVCVPHSARIAESLTRTNLEEFAHIRARIGAEPVVAVYYTREAYESSGIDRVRISFDRDLHFGIMDPSGKRQPVSWCPVPVRGVILEIKFTNTFPFWVRDIVGQSNLIRRGVCKYVLCERATRTASAVPFQ
jgi:hypothetical protein